MSRVLKVEAVPCRCKDVLEFHNRKVFGILEKTGILIALLTLNILKACILSTGVGSRDSTQEKVNQHSRFVSAIDFVQENRNADTILRHFLNEK